MFAHLENCSIEDGYEKNRFARSIISRVPGKCSESTVVRAKARMNYELGSYIYLYANDCNTTILAYYIKHVRFPVVFALNS